MVWRPDTAASTFQLVGSLTDTPTLVGLNQVAVSPELGVAAGDVLGLLHNGGNPIPYDTEADAPTECTGMNLLYMNNPGTLSVGETVDQSSLTPLACRVYSTEIEIRPTLSKYARCIINNIQHIFLTTGS